MHILFVAHERNLGGASRSMLALIDELLMQGHTITVLIPVYQSKLRKELVKRNVSIIVKFYGWWQESSSWKWYLKLAFRFLYYTENITAFFLAKRLKNVKIDIVHSNSSVIDIGLRIAKRLHVKHVWHFREYGKDDFSLEYILGKKKSMEIVNSNTDKIVFISKDLASYYHDCINDNLQVVIYNGIASSYLYKKDIKDFNKDKTIFLSSSNLNRNKGQSLILSACKLLLDEGISDFEVLIAGRASSINEDSIIYEKELHEYADKYLKGNVAFLGYVDDMFKLRKSTDVELVCSKREAFGRVTVEAMMSSNAVIGSFSGANPELISDNKNGLLFKEDDVVDLSQKMKKVILNQEFRNNLCLEAFESSKSFTAKKNAMSIEMLYKEILCN